MTDTADAWEGDDAPAITSISVIEEIGADLPQRTGLVDAAGRPIYRVPERIKMGFLP